MILVTVGTHEDPFDRLVAAAERLAAAGEDVVVQTGTSTVPTPHCTAHRVLPPSALDALVRRAEVVVTHGGPGSILQARAAGHVPIVVPRRSAHGEHVDDHQVAFTRRIADRVRLVDDPARLADAVAAHRAAPAGDPAADDAARSDAFAVALDAVIVDVLATRPRRGALRATFATFMRSRGPRR